MNVLFVDDEAQVLRGIERALEGANVDWNSHFVENANGALAYLSQNSVDAIVTDMRMPGTDGGQLLEIVAAKFPAVVRVVLSGQATRDAVYRAINPMHQYLAKPCNIHELIATLHKSLALREVLQSESLRALVGKVSRLPSTPEIYERLVAELNSDDANATTIGEIVRCDPAMTAKILQCVNSAVFGLKRSVSSPAQAVSLLGGDTIKALVLSVGVFGEYESSDGEQQLAKEIADHSLAVAELAARISRFEGCDHDEISDAFTAGLLHDVGKLILAHELPRQYRVAREEATRQGLAEYKLEMEGIGATHASIGAYLFALWGLPQSVVESVGLHHSINVCRGESFSPLLAVIVANYLVNEQDGTSCSDSRSEVQRLLEDIDYGGHLDVWRSELMSPRP
jgi:putative nucleotidyltransferase with HDIG domain